MTENDIITSNLLSLLETKNFKEIKHEFEEQLSADIANILEEVTNKENITLLFKLLNKDTAAEVFSYLSPEKQQLIVESLSDKEVASILNELFIDDAVYFIEEMPANVVEKVLKNTNAETRATINQILNYPENSAGSLMTTEFLDLKSEMTVQKAFERIRKIAKDKETINTCYVTDSQKVLLGVISIKDLLMAEPEEFVGNLMTTNVVNVNTHDDQEIMTQIFSKYDFSSLPVVDNEYRLVGIVTIDDAIDIIQQENTEDFQKMAAISPTDEEYLKTSVLTHARKRIGWLMFLMLSSFVVGYIITSYENAFLVVPALVGFIPMIMDTGGNSGAQSSTLIIRGLAMNEIGLKDYIKIFYKEFFVSILVGFALGFVNFFRIWLFNADILLALTVSLTLFLTVVIAKLIGFSLPFFAKIVKLDPALMASPIITTLVDILAMAAYFYIATLVMGI